jgi:hypothetical protein
LAICNVFALFFQMGQSSGGAATAHMRSNTAQQTWLTLASKFPASKSPNYYQLNFTTIMIFRQEFACWLNNLLAGCTMGSTICLLVVQFASCQCISQFAC